MAKKFEIRNSTAEFLTFIAEGKAEEEYRLFNPTQQIDSDFDKHIRGLFDEQ